MLYSCDMCSGNRVPFVAPKMALIVNHYGRYHRHDPDVYVTCKIRGCGASYRKFEGYKSHLCRFHKEIDLSKDSDGQDTTHTSVLTSNSMAAEMEPGLEPAVDINKDNHGDCVLNKTFNQQEQNALFLLKTKEIHQLTQKATDSIVADTTSIVKTTVESLKCKVKNCLESTNLQFEDIPGLKEIFRADSPESNPFSGMESKPRLNSSVSFERVLDLW